MSESPAAPAPGHLPSPHRRRAYLAWVAVCFIWGTTYLGIRVSLETIPPGLVGGLRWLIAGSLLAAYLRLQGQRLPPRTQWPAIALLGFLLLGLGNGGVVIAELWVPSGLAAVLVATSPFWMAAVEAALPGGERLHPRIVAGLVIGFSGIVLLVWPDLQVQGGDRRVLYGVIASQVACFGWALGSSYSKRHAPTANVLASTAGQMLAGGLIMIAAGTLAGEWSRLSFSARSLSALLYLSTVGAIGGFVAYTYALRHLSVSFVSLYAYINPIIAVGLGILILGEPFNSRMATAAALVFAGVAAVHLARQSRSPEP